MPSFAACFLLLAVLTACSFDTAEKSAAPPPGAVSKPPRVASSVPSAPSPFDALKALSPPQGLKSAPLFNDPTKDSDARFERIERSVQQLRDDVDTAAPTIVRLAAVEKDMKNLIRQLETLSSGPVAAPAVPVEAEDIGATQSEQEQQEGMAVADDAADASGGESVPEPAPLPPLPLSNSGEKFPVKETPLQGKPAGQPTTQTEESEPPAVATQQPPAEASLHDTPSTPQESPPAPSKESQKLSAVPAAPVVAGVHVLKWRLGEHPDKTRIVLELSGNPVYTAKVENGQLVVDLPGTAWDPAREWTTDSAPLVYAYHVGPGDKGGLRLKIDMLYDADIIYQKVFPAEVGAPAKLVIDLKSATIHR